MWLKVQTWTPVRSLMRSHQTHQATSHVDMQKSTFSCATISNKLDKYQIGLQLHPWAGSQLL